MGRFAPTAPVHILQALKHREMLGHYNFLLAHDVLEHDVDFRMLFDDPFSRQTIIIDNSVIELGKPMDAKDILHAATSIRPIGHSMTEIVIVLPDVLMDAEETIKVTRQGLKDWDNADGRRFKFMFVPQAQSLQELIYCAEQFADERRIEWIGVARNLVPFLGSRKPAIEALRVLFPSQHFHLLGFSDDILDDVLCTRLPGIAGIDSAVPMRIGSLGLPLKLSSVPGEYPPRSEQPNWWAEGEMTQQLIDNVTRFRQWIR